MESPCRRVHVGFKNFEAIKMFSVGLEAVCSKVQGGRYPRQDIHPRCLELVDRQTGILRKRAMWGALGAIFKKHVETRKERSDTR